MLTVLINTAIQAGTAINAAWSAVTWRHAAPWCAAGGALFGAGRRRSRGLHHQIAP